MATPGRPSKIDQIVNPQAPPGDQVTVAEQIVRAVRGGNYVETAAALAGVHKVTLYAWINIGEDAQTKTGRLTAHEKRCLEFHNAITVAMASSETEDVATLTTLGRGIRRVERIVVDEAGNTISRTVTTEGTQPDARVLMWRLERRFGERWGRNRLELSGPDGGPVPVSISDEQGAQIGDVLMGTLGEVFEELRRDLGAGLLTLERLGQIEEGVPAILRQQVERVVEG